MLHYYHLPLEQCVALICVPLCTVVTDDDILDPEICRVDGSVQYNMCPNEVGVLLTEY